MKILNYDEVVSEFWEEEMSDDGGGGVDVHVEDVFYWLKQKEYKIIEGKMKLSEDFIKLLEKDRNRFEINIYNQKEEIEENASRIRRLLEETKERKAKILELELLIQEIQELLDKQGKEG